MSATTDETLQRWATSDDAILKAAANDALAARKAARELVDALQNVRTSLRVRGFGYATWEIAVLDTAIENAPEYARTTDGATS